MAGALILAAGLIWWSAAGASQPDLSKLSIEQLGEVEVTSVSKRPEALNQAASAVYVITHEEIVRSGAVRLPEILRLAPNLEVAQTSASAYVITARGFNGAPAAQNFSNKLLVMIDGRSVYTPLFSGVYWDMQDVPVEDIERIEVISGPGGTLWGANAVNGVINIITRKASAAPGMVIDASAGNRERRLALRYAGQVSDTLSYRVYGQLYHDGDSDTATGASNPDRWTHRQAGFRLDWTPSAADLLTLQGDSHSGEQGQLNAPAETVEGQNLTGRWTHSFADGSALNLQGYFDRAARGAEVDGSGFAVNTVDAQVQYSFNLGTRNTIVMGGGARASRYRIDGSANLRFEPAGRTLTQADVFAQDTVQVSDALKLTLGAKLEDDAYVHAQLMPNARLAWTPNSETTLWAAVSRAVRAPTPFDRDVVELLGGQRFLIGGPTFQPETLTAVEAGTRVQPLPSLSLSLNGYLNDYEGLRSIELAPAGFLPLRWGNGMKGRTYGLEAWSQWQAASWWRLSASTTVLHERFTFTPGASGLLGPSQAADDPKYQASLKSSMDWGHTWMLDAQLRYVSALPNPRIPAYTELNGRLAWNLSRRITLALDGRNLLHARHIEYPQGSYIPRSLTVAIQCRF